MTRSNFDAHDSPRDTRPRFNESANAQAATGNLILGNTTKSVHMQAVFESPVYITVQIDAQPPSGGAPAYGFFDAYAVIGWSVKGGGTVRRTVSVGNGVTISAPAQGVTVSVFDQSTTYPLADGTEYFVTIQATPDSRPSTTNPPWLEGYYPAQLIPPLGTLALIVPQGVGAHSAQVLLSQSVDFFPTVSTIPITAIVSQANSGAAEIPLASYNPQAQTGFVPLASGCNLLLVYNTSTTDTYQCSVKWGIDG